MARHLVISGKVQGVGYREWLRQEAGLRGLAGWVRNRLDGTVEAVVAGAPDQVAAIIQACASGPRWAEVRHVAQSPTEWTGGSEFQRLPSL